MKSKLDPEKQRKEVRHLTKADLQKKKKPQGENTDKKQQKLLIVLTM